jgi:hypothetical protein
MGKGERGKGNGNGERGTGNGPRRLALAVLVCQSAKETGLRFITTSVSVQFSVAVVWDYRLSSHSPTSAPSDAPDQPSSLRSSRHTAVSRNPAGGRQR